MSRRRAGFVDIELMIGIAVFFIGLAFVIPPLVKLWKHQPMSGGNWAGLIVGACMVLVTLGAILRSYVPALRRDD